MDPGLRALTSQGNRLPSRAPDESTFSRTARVESQALRAQPARGTTVSGGQAPFPCFFRRRSGLSVLEGGGTSWLHTLGLHDASRQRTLQSLDEILCGID